MRMPLIESQGTGSHRAGSAGGGGAASTGAAELESWPCSSDMAQGSCSAALAYADNCNVRRCRVEHWSRTGYTDLARPPQMLVQQSCGAPYHRFIRFIQSPPSQSSLEAAQVRSRRLQVQREQQPPSRPRGSPAMSAGAGTDDSLLEGNPRYSKVGTTPPVLARLCTPLLQAPGSRL